MPNISWYVQVTCGEYERRNGCCGMDQLNILLVHILVGLQQISFSNKTSTEECRDYITIFKDKTRTSFWGNQKRLSGSPDCGWPGANGRPPLMIPSDRVVIQFHTDHSVEDWGFKVTLQVHVCVCVCVCTLRRWQL